MPKNFRKQTTETFEHSLLKLGLQRYCNEKLSADARLPESLQDLSLELVPYIKLHRESVWQEANSLKKVKLRRKNFTFNYFRPWFEAQCLNKARMLQIVNQMAATQSDPEKSTKLTVMSGNLKKSTVDTKVFQHSSKECKLRPYWKDVDGVYTRTCKCLK